MITWRLDTSHSTIGFKVKHLMISTVRGSFTEFDGTITSTDETLENADMKFTAQTKSILTNNENRDEHLRGEDFFHVSEFPELNFSSTSVTVNANKIDITGDLTMRGVTKAIQLSGEFAIGSGMQGGKVLALELTGTLNREDFGLMWNHVLEAGGVTVSKEVVLDIHLEATQS